MERIIGMSTGTLFKSVPAVSQLIINLHKSLGSRAIELGCSRKSELSKLFDLDDSNIRSHFSHVSLHAPTDLEYKFSSETADVLKQIWMADRRFHFDCVVIHPDTVTDWSVLEELRLPIAIENSDSTQDFGRTVAELDYILDGTNHGFVLDVNHCFSNDRSMDLARAMTEKFSDRLREIHLSGFTQYHEPISMTKQYEILEAVPVGDVPIIIESVCNDESQAREEYAFVRNYFSCK